MCSGDCPNCPEAGGCTEGKVPEFVDVVLSIFQPLVNDVVMLEGAKISLELGGNGAVLNRVLDDLGPAVGQISQELIGIAGISDAGPGFDLARNVMARLHEILGNAVGTRDSLKEIMEFERICGDLFDEEEEEDDDDDE